MAESPPNPPTIGQPGPPDASDALWDAEAQKMELEAVSRIRGTAEKWAGGITAILGIFGAAAVIKGPDDLTKVTDPYGDWATVLVLLASAFAAVALITTLLAAQGTPQKVELLTGDRLRRWSRTEANRARKQLAASRYLTVAAVILVGIAVGFAWLAPSKEDDSEPAVLVIGHSVVACGVLTEANGQTVTVEGETSTQQIPVRDLVTLVELSSCP